MVKLTKYKLRLNARNRGINNYLSTLDKLDGITENLSKNGFTLFVLINAGQIIARLMFAGLMFVNFL